MVDYLVVGAGIGGVAMAETLLNMGRSVLVFDDGSQRASKVAGGLYNPVVLKRFSLAWEGQRLMSFSIPFYESLEKKLGVSIDEKLSVLRLLGSVKEQNDWFKAADQPGLDKFLSTRILPNENPFLHAPCGYGEVLNTGRVHTTRLLEAYKSRLSLEGKLREEFFDFDQLRPEAEGISYKDVKAASVIFCEGFGLRKNPYFNYLPLNGTKGELLVINAPELKEPRVIKSGVFIIPIGEDRYLVGATYKWKDYTNTPTEDARTELLEKLKKFLLCDFEVEEQHAGIRPTVPDRRPLVGRHPLYHQLYVLNGLGSRGVLIAPYAAHCLYRFMEVDDPIPEAMDCTRFVRRFEKAQRHL